REGGTIGAAIEVRNEGDMDSDEVVQLYGAALASRVRRPLRQLLAFKRERVPAGRSVYLAFRIEASDLPFWAVTRVRWCLETAQWTITAGPSSADRRLETTLAVIGETVPPRDPTLRTLATHYDDCASVYLDECAEGGAAVIAKPGAWLRFDDAQFPDGTA